MIALYLADGHLNNTDQVKSEDIDRVCCKFPFTMMNNISQGEWVLVENEFNKTN